MGTHLRVLSERYPNEYIFEKYLNIVFGTKVPLALEGLKKTQLPYLFQKMSVLIGRANV